MTITDPQSLDVDADDTQLAPTQRAAPDAPRAWSLADSGVLDYDEFDDDSTELWTDEDDREYARTTVKMFMGLMAVVVIGCIWIAVAWLHRAPDSASAPAVQAPTTQQVVPSGPDDQIVPPTPTAAPAPPPQTVTVTQTPALAASPPVQTVVPPRPSAAALDEQFLGDLTAAGITITDVRLAVEGAHATCAYIAQGHTKGETVTDTMRNNASLTYANTVAYVDAAVAVYCPQFEG